MIGKLIKAMTYSFESYKMNPIILEGKIIDRIKVPFKQELEVLLIDAYLVSTIEGYTFVTLPMDVQVIFNS